MVLEKISCIHCGFEFRINLEKLFDDGETTVVRGLIRNKKRNTRKAKMIDIICPKCSKTFEYKVK